MRGRGSHSCGLRYLPLIQSYALLRRLAFSRSRWKSGAQRDAFRVGGRDHFHFWFRVGSRTPGFGCSSPDHFTLPSLRLSSPLLLLKWFYLVPPSIGLGRSAVKFNTTIVHLHLSFTIYLLLLCLF